MHNTVLILGARGRFGLAAARAFASAGWRVFAQKRPGAPVPAAAPIGVEWLDIAPADTGALALASKGAEVVVHALNPSAYTGKAWRAEVLPMADNAIAIARELGARLMVPGNVYNFGAGMPSHLLETTPQNAQTVKGRVRVQMEERLKASRVPCVVIRAGDFFGSGSNSWFDLFLVKKIHKGQITYPGHLDVPTAWAYLPDLAGCFVAVAAKRAQLPSFEVLHFGGYSLTGRQWLEVLNPIAQARGWVLPGSSLKFSRLPWPLLRLGALAVPTLASVLEMRYLWDTPHALANEKLLALTGAEPHTPLPVSVQAALEDLGLTAPAQVQRELAGVAQ